MSKDKKKNKKATSIWDLTAEEQEKSADAFYEFENGGDILSLSKGIKKAPLNDNGMSDELEATILSDLRGDRRSIEVEIGTDDKNSEESISYSDFLKMSNDATESIQESIDKEDYIKEHAPFFNIRLKINEVLRRMVIDDGVTPTSFSFDAALFQDICGTYDADDVIEKVDILKKYIISLKHPAAEFTASEFFDHMKIISDYDKDKFMFMAANGYVSCYLLDTNTFSKFDNWLEGENYPPEEILRTYLSLAYTVGTVQNAFFVEDVKYLATFYSDSDLNRQKDFLQMFLRDVDTEVLNVEEIPNDDEDLKIKVIDVQTLHEYARTMMATVSGDELEDDDYDEDDWGDEDESDEEEVEEETTVESENDLDVSDLVTDDMEMVDNTSKSEEMVEEVKPVIQEQKKTEKNQKSSDDEMVLPVTRKK